MRSNKSRLKITLAVLIPLLLFLVIRERLSWRPRTLHCPDSVVSVAYSPDGKWLACAGDPWVELREASSLQVVWTKDFGEHGAASIAFSPDSQTLALRWVTSLEFLDIAKRKIIWSQTGTIGRDVGKLVFAPDNSLVVLLGRPLAHSLWNFRTGRVTKIGELDLGDEPLAFAPNGTTLAAANELFGLTHVDLWQMSTRKVEHFLVSPQHYSITCLAFAPDNKTIATGTVRNTLYLWNAATGQLSQTLYTDGSQTDCVAFSPDAQLLAVGKEDGTVQLWDTATRTFSRAIAANQGSVLAVAFSPDGLTLATVGVKGNAQLWRIK